MQELQRIKTRDEEGRVIEEKKVGTLLWGPVAMLWWRCWWFCRISRGCCLHH